MPDPMPPFKAIHVAAIAIVVALLLGGLLLELWIDSRTSGESRRLDTIDRCWEMFEPSEDDFEAGSRQFLACLAPALEEDRG